MAEELAQLRWVSMDEVGEVDRLHGSLHSLWGARIEGIGCDSSALVVVIVVVLVVLVVLVLDKFWSYG